MSFVSETLKPLDETLDFSGDYNDFQLIRESPRGKLYSACRAGKRFIMKAAASDGGRDLEMLKREYEMSISLSHPNIAYVFTYEKESAVGPCIVMEYVDGRSLRQFLNEKPSLDVRKKVFSQILDVVGYLHGKGLVHNDLSPENILITRSNSDVKLIDFGFSDDDTHYLAHSLGGTPGYASPELLRGEKVDARSDVWTIGALMKDIFGRRYVVVYTKCQSTRPSDRYPDVRSVRRVWKGYWVPIWCVVFFILLALISGFTTEFYRQREFVQKAVAEKNLQDEQFEALKAKVDAWYESELPVYREKFEMASKNEKSALWHSLAESYNAFASQLIVSCPEELSTRLITYLTMKYNSEYPISDASTF